MNKLILIIHSSEIIRKGLAAILRSFFNIEIIQLKKTEELISYQEMKDFSIVCIIERAVLTNLDSIHILLQQNQMKLISFGENDRKIAGQINFEYSISEKTSALELQEIFSESWNIKDKPNRLQENDELTNREKDVLKLVALGHSNKIIAEKLFISIHTVISHRKNITEKTGIKSISGLTVFAILNNLIDTETINPEDLI